ncbi:expressed unknown protein [Seminavis robusta]|uniref:Uncharacterized protein n=1 Tax=Seminavis robusta TaxID=568900 RepID=A0A9N8EDL1_9STRA|nr:expressed unknown protein [Seminavis robusta]|eukprot:Sro995_g229200.1 n/a (418) ;mRNA; f:28728-29981
MALNTNGRSGTAGHQKRTGYWSCEEKAYLDELIKQFMDGSLVGLENGTTLRSHLAARLDCHVKRISKRAEKIAKGIYNGRSTYVGKDFTLEESNDRGCKLERLRRAFLDQLDYREELQDPKGNVFKRALGLDSPDEKVARAEGSNPKNELAPFNGKDQKPLSIASVGNLALLHGNDQFWPSEMDRQVEFLSTLNKPSSTASLPRHGHAPEAPSGSIRNNGRVPMATALKSPPGQPHHQTPPSVGVPTSSAAHVATQISSFSKTTTNSRVPVAATAARLPVTCSSQAVPESSDDIIMAGMKLKRAIIKKRILSLTPPQGMVGHSSSSARTPLSHANNSVVVVQVQLTLKLLGQLDQSGLFSGGDDASIHTMRLALKLLRQVTATITTTTAVNDTRASFSAVPLPPEEEPIPKRARLNY